MKFSELITNLTESRLVSPGSADVAGITYDSRQVKPGYVFVAMQGGSHDGHSYIPAVVESGACGIVAEREVDGIPMGIGYVVVPNGRRALGEMAAPFYGYPSRSMKLVGVTGTSGKTTVTHLIQSVFTTAGQKAGLIGTLGARINDRLIPTAHTTPESVDVQRILREMADQGVDAVAMEASSHGLHQGRTLGCEFDCGVFTNIARDHLDYHVTFENYLDAKLILFRDYPRTSNKPFTAVINADDASAEAVKKATIGRVVTFGVTNPADVKAENVDVTDKAVEFDMHHQESRVRIKLNIGGAFNVYNALSATAAGIALGVPLSDIVVGLAHAKAVPGRFESVECGQDFGVLVDYAHTPDELENVLTTARNLVKNRLIAVFGCGGDRDRGKRPIMGGIGAELADIVVVTSDNPRTEDPDFIISQILDGVPAGRRSKVETIPDRREAIHHAIAQAESGDIVVIAGKGHEDYQIFADRTIHFDDREVAREALGS
jgi:UDP-N-acetylmuramoyl-L-alanyl-D-glutamate--2,6-diaminopimelate ligase